VAATVVAAGVAGEPAAAHIAARIAAGDGIEPGRSYL
jgi:hypothetical protein